jgi:hypothetical protein
MGGKWLSCRDIVGYVAGRCVAQWQGDGGLSCR